MLKKTVTYEDWDGNTRKEDLYFNLTMSELMEMELSTAGGMEKKLQKIIDAQDRETIVKTFKDIILKSYGEKSDDGKRFMKSEEISRAFSETPAYDQIFVELITDETAASEFINGLVSNEMRKRMAEAEKAGLTTLPGNAD